MAHPQTLAKPQCGPILQDVGRHVSGPSQETLAVIHVAVEGHEAEIANALQDDTPTRGRVYVLLAAEDEAHKRTDERDLASLLGQLQQDGHESEGRLGDSFVLDSVADIINERAPDRIVVVTPPLGLPDRLHLDLAHRISHAFGVPTTHVVIRGGRWSGGIDLSVGAGDVVARQRASESEPVAPAPYRPPAWATRALPVVVVLLVVALVATFIISVHQKSVDNRKLLISQTAPQTTFAALAGTPAAGGSTREYPAFFPALIKIHAGDSIAFTNPTADVPHTVTFGVTSDRSNEPVFGAQGGGPIPAVVAPCATGEALTKTTLTCPAPVTTALPAFAGQAYYSSGILAPQQRFVLRTAANLPPGTYHYVCLIHVGQAGTIVVEPHGSPTQVEATVDQAALAQEHRDAAILANLRPPNPAAGTVQAGVAGLETSLNQFFPSSIDVRAGQEVTWVNRGGTPHVIIFGGYVDPATAPFSPPTAPSGSAYVGGLFNAGAIGTPPYPTTSFTLRFTQPGIYTYICSLHPGMGGTVIVHS